MFIKKRAQATTELAITGVIIIMLLTYLLQRGYIYNCMQSLEMYTFRRALQLSQQQERGISLTVIRDVIVPSFFTGVQRQRLVSTASVEYNPYIIYEPDNPQDIPKRVLLQIGEPMIRNNYYFEIPPTKLKIETTKDEKTAWRWEVVTPTIDAPIFDPKKAPFTRKEVYSYVTHVAESPLAKSTEKNLTVEEEKPLFIIFKSAQEIEDEIKKGDWEGTIKSVEVDSSTIPKDINLIIKQIIKKSKTATTY